MMELSYQKTFYLKLPILNSLCMPAKKLEIQSKCDYVVFIANFLGKLIDIELCAGKLVWNTF